MPQEQCQHCGKTVDRYEPLFLVDDQTRVVCRECHDELDPRCPSCGARLKRRLKARGKCKTCGEPIVVEDRHTLFPSSMITEAQRDELHQLWAGGLRSLLGDPYRRYADRKDKLRAASGCEPTVEEVLETLRDDISRESEIREALHHLEPFGVTYESWLQRESTLHSSLGRAPTCLEIADAFWRDALRGPSEADTSNEYGRQFSVYFRMADWLRRSGRDPAPALQSAEVCRLRQSQCASIHRVKVLAEAGTCKTCRQNRSAVLQGRKVLDIQEAIEAVPRLIGCKRDGCVGLMFEVVFDDE